MGAVTGSGLASRSAIIDLVMQHIIDEVDTPPVDTGETITRDRSTGTVGSDNVEQWLTIPATRMSSGKAMPFGFRPEPGAVNYLSMNVTHLDYNTASATDARDFDKFDGQLMNRVDEDGSGTIADDIKSNGFNIDTPYLRHWVFTNPNFGALVSGNYGALERTYLYIVVEVALNTFRTFGWCDVIQLGTWTTPASGFYAFGNRIQRNDNFGAVTFSSSNIFMGSIMINALTQNANVPGGIVGVTVADEDANALWQPDRDGVNRDWLTSALTNIGDNQDMLTSNEPRALGQDHDGNPASFSGVALRTPIYLFGTRWTVAQVAGSQAYADADSRWQMLAELPDAFYCNIRDLDPGTIFDDGTDRFLVLPLFSKGDMAGNRGILIKTVDL
jgi:hypothetical protein